MTSRRKETIMDAEVSTHTFLTMIIEEVVGNIIRLETCMDSLVNVPPYSKLSFQGNIFFTQNWCNITLSFLAFFLIG
jgi:hypothetical protein